MSRFHVLRFKFHVMMRLAILVIIFFTAGCEEDVTSVLGTERPFSLYGVVSPQMDTQWVRVYPIEEVLEPAAAAPLDARFTTLDIESGEVRTWSDSLIREIDGQFAHVFWAPFSAEYGHTYRIEVTRSDEAVTRVDAAVPVRAELELQEATPAPATHPVRVNEPVPRIFDVRVTYAVSYQLAGTPRITAHFQVDYDELVRRQSDGWLINVALWQDYSAIRRALLDIGDIVEEVGIILDNLSLNLIVANEEWDPPGGEFDVDVLVQPGLFSNVENGFGFVGAGYRLSVDWVPPEEVTKAAGFVPAKEEDRGGR